MSDPEVQRIRFEPTRFSAGRKISQCSLVVVCVALGLSARPALAEGEPSLDETGQHEDSSSVEQQPIPQPEPARSYRLQWHYKRVHWAEGVTAGALGIAAIVIEFAPIHVEARWTRRNGFDDWFQRRLVAPGDKQQRYGKASDALAATSIAFPVLVDLVGMTLIGDRNKDVGLQMFAIQAQAFESRVS